MIGEIWEDFTEMDVYGFNGRGSVKCGAVFEGWKIE
jgi:hypothetical protein